jgi:hypothetical protein
MKSLFAAFAAALLSGCTMLSAETPLFSAADHAPEFAPPEGLWAAREGPDCKVNPARSRPERETCLDWYRVKRAEDGTWRVTSLSNDDPEEMRVVVMAAAPRKGEELAPLYVGEFANAAADDISYFAMVPRGGSEQPLSRLAIAGVQCFVVHGEWGEIPGIILKRGEENGVIGCTATTKDSVREAARRAAIAALPELADGEIMFVRR